MVFSHIEDFLELKKEAAGLGFWCEQSFESCHHYFKVSLLSNLMKFYITFAG
jgi:hypothetical protein